MHFAATKSEKAIFSAKVTLKLTMSSTLVSFEKMITNAKYEVFFTYG